MGLPFFSRGRVVLYTCCEKGALVIKCSYYHSSEDVGVIAASKKNCLIKAADGSVHLSNADPNIYLYG